MTEENRNYHGKYLLTLVFASVFLFSFGMVSHNAFADTVTSTIPVNGAYGVATNPNTNLTYVATGNGYQVQVINDSTNQVITTIQTQTAAPSSNSGTCMTLYVAVNPSTNLIYAHNGGCSYQPPGSTAPTYIPNSVSVINGTTNNVVAIISLPFGYLSSQPIQVNPATNKIYALDYSQGLEVIDGNTNAVTVVPDPTPNFCLSTGSCDLAVNSQTNMIYVLEGNQTCVIDGATNSVVKTFGWGKSSDYGIGVNPATNLVYVSNSDNSVSAIDGTSYQVMATVQGVTHGYVGVNPVTNKIYVGNFAGFGNTGGNTISVIDGQTNSVVNQVQVGQIPFGIGINVATNKIYVGNSGSATVSVIDGSSPTAPSISLSSYWAECCFGTLQVTGSVQNPVSGNNQLQLLIYAPNGNLVLNQTELTGGFQADYGISRSDGKGNYTIIGTYDNSAAKQLLPSWINNDPSVSVQVSEDTTGSVFIFGMISNDIAGENASVVITNSTNSTLATYASGSGMHGEVNQNIDSASAAKIFTQSANYNIIVTHIPTGIKGEKVLAYTIPPPPQPPTNLSATAASSSQINLSWTAPANNGGPAITGYMIERSTDGGSTWSTIVSNIGSTTTTYSDSGLAHSTTYTYRVSAINDFRTGQPSNTASATTFNTVPTPPTGLTANAQLFKINLSWNAPSDNGGTPITGYMIERSTNNGSTWSTLVSNTSSTGTTYSDKNVLPLTTYTYRVSAINNIGTGNPSNTASASIAGTSTLP